MTNSLLIYGESGYLFNDMTKRLEWFEIDKILISFTYGVVRYIGTWGGGRTDKVLEVERLYSSKEIGWPVVVMDTLEYYAGSADDEVLEMDVHEYVEKKYNDYHIVYICNTYNDMVERLDGYIYGIMDKDGKVICDLAEPDYINLASGGVINEDNVVDDDMINHVLEFKVKIVILNEESYGSYNNRNWIGVDIIR